MTLSEPNIRRRRSWILRVGATLLVGVVLFLGSAPAGAQGSALETFDTDLGRWGTSFGNEAGGFDFGWSDTANAGGAPGEFGGLFVRVNQPTGDLAMPRVLDTASLSSVGLNDSLSVSGTMWLQHVSDSASSDVHIGYFNSANPTNERLILRILPNGSDIWRFRLAANQGQGVRVDAPSSFDSVVLDFRFDWVPSGLGDGTGSATGSVSDGVTTLDLPTPFPASNTAAFDSFGVWVNSASSTDVTRQQSMFFDDVEYTVPEPASIALGLGALLGLAGLCAREVRRPRAR